ncbi:MAG: ABC transporter ATP-binding protein, partial [Acutalibacteraceae bacterium]
ICLLGVSGVGKSTFFNVLSGLVVPDSGRVLLGEEDITGQTGRISYMQQKDLLLPHKRIVDNIALPLVLKGVPRKQARQQVSSGLAEFGLEGTERKYPGQLSGGMRQRAALYRTYLFNSEVALLDEPFSAVDAITKSQLHLWYLEMMSSLHMSAIFITHDIDEAIFLSDRIYIMSGAPGRITQELTIRHPRPRTTRFTASQEFMEYKRQILDALKIQ